MGYPIKRMRRLRRNENIRRMMRETALSVSDLIQPLFVVTGEGIKKEIDALPGNYHLSTDYLIEEVKMLHALGIPAVLLFGVRDKKGDSTSEAYDSNGLVQQTVRAIKDEVPDITVITDVCLCEHTPHGFCGFIKDGYVENDSTVQLLAKVALSHAQAGADIVAPAAMMDGQVQAIRTLLDKHMQTETMIMGYAVKYASKLYDPFRKHGTKSSETAVDKKTHQMDFANSDEAMREIALDIEEGADIVMVKPGMFYLDIVYRANQEFGVPLAVYNVSGEYAMVKSAAEMGRIDEKEVMMELLTSFKRAGANLIISYHAKDAAEVLNLQADKVSASQPIGVFPEGH